MREIILTPVKFEYANQTIQTNVSVWKNEKVAHISDCLKPYINFFYGISWTDEANKEPIPFSEEIIRMYEIKERTHKNSGWLDVGHRNIRAAICYHEGSMKIRCMYKEHFIIMDYLHELQIVYKLLTGEDWSTISSLSGERIFVYSKKAETTMENTQKHFAPHPLESLR